MRHSECTSRREVVSRAFAGVRGRKCARLGGRPCAEVLEQRVFLAAQLVADLVPGPTGGQPRDFLALGDRLIFSTGGTQPGLWASDGTELGTQRISDAAVRTDSYEGRSAAAFSTAALFFNGPG